MIAIGISGFAHDSAVAIVDEGLVRFALEEERVTRRKDAWLFPAESLSLALRECGLDKRRVDHIAFYWDDLGSLIPAVASELSNLFSPDIKTLARIQNRCRASRSNALLRDTIRKFWHPLIPPKIHFIEHHVAHAMYSYRVSGFRNALVAVIDGRGEFKSLSAYLCTPSAVRCVRRVGMPASLGFLYAAVTQHLGFSPLADEYRVMGLASFGRPVSDLSDFFDRLVRKTSRGFNFDFSYTAFQHTEAFGEQWLSKRALEHLGAPRAKGATIQQRHADVAYALQQKYEEVVLGLLTELATEFPGYPLALAGGCAMNSVCNGRILRSRIFPDFFIPVAPGDQGAAIGAALSLYGYSTTICHAGQNARAQLGPEFPAVEVKRFLREMKISFIEPDDPIDALALLIGAGYVGGVFHGPMEFGPRALGYRSILADPRSADMTTRLNEKVKHREAFRPFAAAILRERTVEFTGFDFASPFMNIVMPIREDRRSLVPAVTHVDGTCRFQTVDELSNPFLWNLLKRFDELAGVPLLLNTSFNLSGEPIVNTPNEAVHCFKRTDIDFLYIENCLILKDVVNFHASQYFNR